METHGGSVRPNSISSRGAIRELHQRVKAAIPAADPAPWFEVSPAFVEMFSNGDEVTLVRRKKMEERTTRVMLRALLAGNLRAHFSDGLDSRDIPGWAWQGTDRNEAVWFEGRLPLDVLLPDEWQRWSCHSVYFDRNAFAEWMDCEVLHDPAGLPEMPSAYDAETKPEQVRKRLPPDKPFVSLSEALSWIAFDVALDRNSLDRAISGHVFDAKIDPQVALTDAMAKLAVLSSGGQIAARGKYLERHSTDENSILTTTIDPIRFEDFAQFDILYDGLRYGTGLTWNGGGGATERTLQDRRDAFRSVKVNRADLLREFPNKDGMARALLFSSPASLPDIGPVMALDEALSWLACGKPSHDIEVWKNAAGDLILLDPGGEVVEPTPHDSPPPTIEAFQQASRTLHSAMRGGSLLTYVAPSTAAALAVPRLYWNSVNPDSLDHVYRGIMPDDYGAGCAVLLSRQEFHGWRAEITARRLANTEIRSTAKGERECKEWLVSAFAADPGMKRSKKSFRDEALAKFAGRLSIRGFSRVWVSIALESGRSKPGRKS